MNPPYQPSLEDLQKAQRVFLKNEPRNLFYRVATELVDLAIQKRSTLTLTEALAVLLQTWNRAYYQFRRFDDQHFTDLDTLIEEYQWVIEKYRNRSILSFHDREKQAIEAIFHAFETILGAVGGAKSMHLLAPRFFPLWDREIAKQYGCTLGPKGTNAGKYCSFMKLSKSQCQGLQDKGLPEDYLLKTLDEYNYCKFTKGWI